MYTKSRPAWSIVLISSLILPESHKWLLSLAKKVVFLLSNYATALITSFLIILPDLNPRQHLPQGVQHILLFLPIQQWTCFMTGSLWQIPSVRWKMMHEMIVTQQLLMTMFCLLALRKWDQVCKNLSLDS